MLTREEVPVVVEGVRLDLNGVTGVIVEGPQVFRVKSP